MEQAPVIFIVNGNTYSLSAGDTQAIRAISAEDRRQLIALLEAIKEQERLSQAAVQAAANQVGIGSEATLTSAPSSPSPERLGGGDVLMARLIMEETRNKKPPISSGSLYKWLGVTLALVVLLVVIL